MPYSSRIFAIAGVGLLISGCGGSKERPADSSAAPAGQRVSATPRKPNPDDVVTLAQKYHFAAQLSTPVPATAPIDKGGKNKGLPKGQDPKLTFARAERVTGTSYPSDQEVLLLIHGDHDYSGLDIAQGNNYIWRDRSDPDPTKWTVWLVSDHPRNAVMLTRGKGPYSSVDPGTPHLVMERFQVNSPDSAGGRVTDMIAYGACIDDDACLPTHHCGYSE